MRPDNIDRRERPGDVGELPDRFPQPRTVACVFAVHRVVAEALSQLLETLGYVGVICDPGEGVQPRGNVAVWDLSAHTPPFPAPPDMPTIALTSGGDHDTAELLALGYRGYLRPRSNQQMLARALEAVMRGEFWAERRMLAPRSARRRPTLTRREEQVLALIAKGLHNRQIADRLGVAEKTIKAHVSSLLSKSGARNRVDLAIQHSRVHSGASAD